MLGCDFCSMSALLVSPSPGVECSTPVLDNPSQNDFDTCDENSFSGATLGECEDFEVPASDLGWEVHLSHTGAGGWRGDHLDIIMDDDSFVRCALNDQLLDNDVTIVFSCT